jgi:hypothetical protein
VATAAAVPVRGHRERKESFLPKFRQEGLLPFTRDGE